MSINNTFRRLSDPGVKKKTADAATFEAYVLLNLNIFHFQTYYHLLLFYNLKQKLL